RRLPDGTRQFAPAPGLAGTARPGCAATGRDRPSRPRHHRTAGRARARSRAADEFAGILRGLGACGPGAQCRDDCGAVRDLARRGRARAVAGAARYGGGMKRASATRSSIASAARQPRREALLRSGVALATAVMLGVLGLLAGERNAERPGAAEAGARNGEQAAPPAERAQFSPPSQTQPSASAASPSGAPQLAVAAPALAPSSSAESRSAPVGGQIVASQPVDSAH